MELMAELMGHLKRFFALDFCRKSKASQTPQGKRLKIPQEKVFLVINLES